MLWAWVTVHLRRDRLPQRRVVVRFVFPDEPTTHRRFWLLVERGDAELCYEPPGEHDVEVVARSEAFTHWHVGKIEWGQALRSKAIRVSGPRGLARAVPTWNERAVG